MGIIEESRRALLMAQLRSGGGGGRQVIGTFTATAAEKGTVKTIDLGYTGDGYPIAVQVFPSDGAYNDSSSAYSRLQQYGYVFYSSVKNYITGDNRVPTYSGGGNPNSSSVSSRYKSSATSSSNLTNAGVSSYANYTTNDPTATSTRSLNIYNNTTLKVLIANTSYGFMDGIEYTYIVTYSA